MQNWSHKRKYPDRETSRIQKGEIKTCIRASVTKRTTIHKRVRETSLVAVIAITVFVVLSFPYYVRSKEIFVFEFGKWVNERFWDLLQNLIQSFCFSALLWLLQLHSNWNCENDPQTIKCLQYDPLYKIFILDQKNRRELDDYLWFFLLFLY